MQLVHKAKNFCMHNEQYSLTQQIKKTFLDIFWLTHIFIVMCIIKSTLVKFAVGEG